MQLAVARVYVGSFMTSLNMAGFSLSLFLLDAARTAALDAPTQASLHMSHRSHAWTDVPPHSMAPQSVIMGTVRCGSYAILLWLPHPPRLHQ